MAKSPTKPTRPTKTGNELTFRFDNEQPFRAADISELLGALASDYKRMSRRELVLANLTTGSLFMSLKEVLEHGLEYAATVNTLLEFGRSISDLISIVRETSEIETIVEESVTGPFASVDKMLKTAAHANAEIRVKYEKANGDKLLVHMKPQEVRFLTIKVEQLDRARRAATKRRKSKKLIPDRSEIMRLAGQVGGNPEILDAIANLLIRQGLEDVVLSIASELENSGQFEPAAIFRNAAKRPSGGIQFITG